MSGGSGSSGRWLVTYADLISLLMVLFLMLFSSSQIQKEKLMAISESLRRALHKDASIGFATGASLLAHPAAGKETSISEAIQEAAKALGLDKSVSVSTDERGLVIAMVDSVFFNPGDFHILSQMRPMLAEVAQFCKDSNAVVRVEGHTDDSPIDKGLAQSNWHLSSLRASEVVQYMIQQAALDPSKISATGYGSGRPLVPNTTAENRARNRRIEIVLVNSEILTRRARKTIPEMTQLDLLQRPLPIQEDAKGGHAGKEEAKPGEKGKEQPKKP